MKPALPISVSDPAVLVRDPSGPGARSPQAPLSLTSELWAALQHEAERAARAEALLGGVLRASVLRHADLGGALAALLACKLADGLLGAGPLEELARAAVGEAATAAADLSAIRDRDPAAGGLVTPFLHYKGFHALQGHRIAHWLRRDGRRDLARLSQARVSERFAVDIHPAVPVGRGLFIDHGTGLVVGETAVIGDDVSILQEVTLGGTAKERGDRHPKVRDGVLLSAGAKVLGNIEVGRGEGGRRQRRPPGRAALRHRRRHPGTDRGVVQGRHSRAGDGSGPARVTSARCTTRRTGCAN
jgi:serine O-acetyltransferase